MKTKFQYVLAATLLAGILDIALAFLNSWLSNGTRPSAVLHFVASGVYGNQAFSGDNHFERMGMILHFLITLIWVIVYLVLAPRISATSRRWIIAGIVYGIVVFLVMNLVVVPLSGTPKFPFRAFPFFKSMVIQVIGTGLPITWLYGLYAYQSRRNGAA